MRSNDVPSSVHFTHGPSYELGDPTVAGKTFLVMRSLGTAQRNILWKLDVRGPARHLPLVEHISVVRVLKCLGDGVVPLVCAEIFRGVQVHVYMSQYTSVGQVRTN